MADQGCVWLFGCRSKSVGAGVDLASTPVLSVTKVLLLQDVDCGAI